MDLRRSYLLLRTRLGAAVLMLVAMAASSGTAATTYYVATNGNDGAAGTRWGAALRTIATGVAKTVADDHVVLSNGVHYVTTFVVIDKKITVRGRTGNRNDVIVNGSYPAASNRCFYVSANGVVADLTVTNAYGAPDAVYVKTWSFGGGVYLTTGGTLRNCLVTRCWASNRAGGVYLNPGGFMTNCAVIGNTATNSTGGGADGGGVFCYQGTVTDCQIGGNAGKSGGGAYMLDGAIKHSDLVGNRAIQNGGGVYNSGVGIVTNCLIQGNRCTAGLYHGGGGVYGTAGTVAGCRIIGNNAGPDGPGGGVTFRTEGHQSLRDCTVASNKSVRGGGIYLTLTDGVARNCLIAANAATNAGSWGGQSGGGIYINDKTGVVVNCTVVNNLAVNGSGGARCDTYGRLVNCVLYTNRVVSGGNHNWYNTGTKMVYSNCFTVPVTGLPGAGNVTGDPRFVDWPAGNYRLTLGSPCVNAGLKENWMNAALDLDRKPRIDPFTSLVDIGAYEYMFVQGTLVRLQ